MTDRAAPAPTDQDRHLEGTRFAVESDVPMRMTLEPAEPLAWFQILEEYHDQYVHQLSTGPLRVMSAMFRHRDRRSGLTHITRQRLADELHLSQGSVSDAIKLLTGHPGRLLAEPDRNTFEPMPGRQFKGRGARQAEPPIRPAESGFGLPNCDSASRIPPLRNARAQSHTNQRDLARSQSHEVLDPELRVREALAGWPGGTQPFGLFGQEAIRRGNVRGLLEDLGLDGALLNAVAAIPGLEVERVLATARRVWHQRLSADANRPRNPVYCLAVRLLDAAGLPVPPRRPAAPGASSPAPRGNLAPHLGSLKSIEQLRRAMFAPAGAAGTKQEAHR